MRSIKMISILVLILLLGLLAACSAQSGDTQAQENATADVAVVTEAAVVAQVPIGIAIGDEVLDGVIYASITTRLY